MIQTVKCKKCGDIVMKDFLREHMLYVHGAGSSTPKKAKEKRPSTPQHKTPRSGSKKGGGVTPKTTQKWKWSNTPPARYKSIAPYVDGSGMAECVLCKRKMPVGQLEDHLVNVHMVTELIRPRQNINRQWVHVFQGGLPGLGKRSR